MKLPSCPRNHPEAEILSAAGAIQSARRKTHAGGPGRPRTKQPRCQCGEMTLKRADCRKHKCVSP
jgi:hypothetical protein